jgi:hypothetical protein
VHSIDIARSETDARQRLHQSLVDNPAWLLVQSEGWRAWFPFLVSAAIICAISAQIDHLDFHRSAPVDASGGRVHRVASQDGQQ